MPSDNYLYIERVELKKLDKEYRFIAKSEIVYIFIKYLNFYFMKQCIFSTLLLFLLVSIQAQDFQLTFAGSGSSTTVDDVFVENLTQGTSITVTGTDILQLSQTVGVNDLYAEDFFLKLFPNPMDQNSKLYFNTVNEEKVSIKIIDNSGRLVIHNVFEIPAGQHCFDIKNLYKGVYLVNLQTSRITKTLKILSINQSSGKTGINHISSTVISDSPNPLNIQKTIESKGIMSVDMQYNDGDVLKLTGRSGTYRTVRILDPVISGTLTFSFIPCYDADDNKYSIVSIGSQTWMAENLKTTHYNNGELILTTSNPNTNISSMSTPKFQWAYNGIEGNVNVYGRLYTWYALTDSRGVCPTGWHLPTDSEWTVLTDYLGGLSVAGGKLKTTGTTHWTNPNIGANNKSGFSALPSGYRHQDGTFGLMASSAYFWTSETGSSSNYGWSRWLQAGASSVTRYGIQTKQLGLSVRCLKD